MPEGFQVGVERGAGELAESLRAARSTWDGATRDGAGACGMDIVARAFTGMRDAWFDEIGVHITILEQVCGADAGVPADVV